AGCGKSEPPAAPADKGKEKAPPGPEPGPGPNPTPGPNPPRAAAVDPAAEKAATDFLKAVGDGAAEAAALTPAFLKAVGKPVAFDADKARGYSTDEAANWLRRVGGGLNFGLPDSSARSPDAV